MWSQNDVITSLLRLTPTSQTAPIVHLRHVQSVWSHWYAFRRHTVAALHSCSHTTWVGYWFFWVSCGVKMMSLRHVWGWQTPQTTSYIHFRHIESVWAYWYAVHQHMVAALYSCTHPTWLRFGGYGSFVASCGVEMISLLYGWGWQPPQTASIIHLRQIQSV